MAWGLPFSAICGRRWQLHTADAPGRGQLPFQSAAFDGAMNDDHGIGNPVPSSINQLFDIMISIEIEGWMSGWVDGRGAGRMDGN